MQTIPFLDLPPLKSIHGTVQLQGSKSISNRALLLAALAKGKTKLKGVLDSDDTRAMLNALQQLGCILTYDDDDLAREISITGLGETFGQACQNSGKDKEEYQDKDKALALFLNNAGTAMRPLTAALALAGGNYKLSGIARMHERPIADLVDALKTMGCQIDYLENKGFPPLWVKTPRIDDDVLAKPIAVKGNVSSQFLSALLLALPIVAKNAKSDIEIRVDGELISKPYIEITRHLLKSFGVDVQNINDERFIIPAGSQYLSPGEYQVEADASSASYFIAAGAIAATLQAPLVIKGVGSASIQGDIRFIEAARAMGAGVVEEPHQLTVYRQIWPLKAISLDCNHIPDAAMTLAMMALYADGTTRLSNIASWRVKETDRIDAMRDELTKIGAQVVTGEDFIQITPPVQWQCASIKTYDDHRMAMSFSLAAFNPQEQHISILDPACVSKTYPDYFKDFLSLAQADEKHIPVITIDGPTASGKGTLANVIAQKLGYHYLDSGVLYRVTAWAALQEGIPATETDKIVKIAQSLPVSFKSGSVWYKENNVTEVIRAEEVGMMASQIAVYPALREALYGLQRSFQQLPGLVADGRDMGTVVFPDATLKIYLVADAKARALRRFKQLKEKNISTTIDDLHADLVQRDARDMNRAIAPLKPADDAYMLDNSHQSVEESVHEVLSRWENLRPFAKKNTKQI